MFADGANHASKFDGTTVTDINTTGAPSDPAFVTRFKDTSFFAGMSSEPQSLVFTAPFTDDDFTPANGAGTIRVDSDITGLFPFRDALFIFCENRIFKMTGSTLSDFAIQPVTRDIGCVNKDTIQEFAGDLLFLGPDGLRTVAATARIGDTALGAITQNVQSIFDVKIKESTVFESVVIPDKTQYRIFFSKVGQGEKITKGIICVRRADKFEFAEIRGVKPSATDTLVVDGDVRVIHGDFSGYVHRQERGNTFDGTAILGRYRSPDLSFGDTGVRKHMQRVILNFKPESAIDADLFVRYDNEASDSARPAAYPLDSSQVAAQFGTATFSTDRKSVV
mgnify:CR=1 FL=1